MKKQILSRVGALLLALVMAVSMTATAWAAEGGEGGDTTSTSPSVTIKAVENVSDSGVIIHGETAELTAKLNDINEDNVASYFWEFSDTNGSGDAQILIFDSGVDSPTVSIIARNRGNTTLYLTVTLENGNIYRSNIKLSVEYAPAENIEISCITESYTVVGDKLNIPRDKLGWGLKATVYPKGASQDAAWTTSDSSVVRINDTVSKRNPMNFYAENPGEATVTARVDDKFATCTVIVAGLRIVQYENGVDENDQPIKTPIPIDDPTEELTIKVGKSEDIAYLIFGDILDDANAKVTWSSEKPKVVEVVDNGDGTATLNALSEGTARITVYATAAYSRTCNVKVVPNQAQDIRVDVPNMILNFAEQTSVKFGDDGEMPTIIDAIKQNCVDVICPSEDENERKKYEYQLKYVSGLSVSSTSQGTLYYGYKSEGDTGSGVGGMEKYYDTITLLGQKSLSDVSFVPKADFTGTATVTYNGYANNGKAFTGKIYLTVSAVEDVGYTTIANNAVQFKGADFSNVCTLKNGRGLSRISLTQPAKGEGTVYYNYSGSSMIEAVSPSKSYYINGAPNINSLSFVPSTGFTGTVKIPYNAVDTAGTKYTGTVTIVVTPANGETYINYSAVSGETIEFKLDDFTNACVSALGAASPLNYVMFTLPSHSEGVLSYSYKSGNRTYAGNVSAGDRFFNTSGSSTIKPISSVRFAPASGTSGSVLINFDGYAADGKHFKGIVRVHIGDNDGGVINYSSSNGAPVKFDVESFNELCQRSIRETLDYVIFDLPSSQRGTLFRNYSNSYSSGTELAEGTKCYQGKTPLISDITFVPNLSFDGTASIGFTAYGENGGHFIGTVVIDVSAPSDRTVKYNVLQGHAVKFNADDFNRMCQVATGKDLNYVRFTVPSSMRGTLCYNYNEQSGNYSSKVNSGSNYNRTGGQLIDNIYYLSESNQTGTIQLTFDGWNTSGTNFSGLVEINVMTPVAKDITYAGNSLAFDMRPSDFTKACVDLTGKRLDYIVFDSLPSSSEGTLYTGFSGPRDHGETARAGTKYYISGDPSIDGLAFLPKAGYDGIVTLGYTGVDVNGTSYTGTVQMAINNYASSGYTDMGNYSWAESSVNFLTIYGVVNGTGNNQFSPSQFMRRADYMVMVCRAFRLNTGSTSGFNDVPANSYYAWAVSTAKDLGIAYGYGNDFRPESPLTREDAMVFLQRTLSVVGEGIGNGSESYLNRFTDGGSVSAYARGAVAAMVQRGLVTGVGNNMLNPKQYMSRAEMASFLHRVLTM